MLNYKAHIKAKCTKNKCNIVTVPEWVTPCPAKDTEFRYGAMDNAEFSNPHPSHCCKLHGCKYGYDDCPVYLEEAEQEYMCEDCDYDSRRFSFKDKAEQFKIAELMLKDHLKDVYNRDITTAKTDFRDTGVLCTWNGGFLGNSTLFVPYEDLDIWARKHWLDYNYDNISR